MVLQERIELSTSPLPRECSTTELLQRPWAQRRKRPASATGAAPWQGARAGELRRLAAAHALDPCADRIAPMPPRRFSRRPRLAAWRVPPTCSLPVTCDFPPCYCPVISFSPRLRIISECIKVVSFPRPTRAGWRDSPRTLPATGTKTSAGLASGACGVRIALPHSRPRSDRERGLTTPRSASDRGNARSPPPRLCQQPAARKSCG